MKGFSRQVQVFLLSKNNQLDHRAFDYLVPDLSFFVVCQLIICESATKA